MLVDPGWCRFPASFSWPQKRRWIGGGSVRTKRSWLQGYLWAWPWDLPNESNSPPVGGVCVIAGYCYEFTLRQGLRWFMAQTRMMPSGIIMATRNPHGDLMILMGNWENHQYFWGSASVQHGSTVLFEISSRWGDGVRTAFEQVAATQLQAWEDLGSLSTAKMDSLGACSTVIGMLLKNWKS